MVVPLIEPRKAELAALCRQFGVRRLEVFGSAATGDYAVAPSDLDFLVEFDERGPARALGWYSGLEEAMEGCSAGASASDCTNRDRVTRRF